MKYCRVLTWALFFALSSSCSRSPSGPVVWVYTSVYNEVVQAMDQSLKKSHPHITVKWFQGGSENVAARYSAELAAGKPQADVIVTSDIFWYEDLKGRGLLKAYKAKGSESVPAALKDKDGFYATLRMPLMVIAYHPDVFASAQAPRGFADLASPRFKDKMSLPNPLESGTAFTAVSVLSQRLGWDYFEKLKHNGALSAGGNSAVLARIESKERPVGMVLLENVLMAAAHGSKVRYAWPDEGAIMVPSPVAITSTARHPEAAQAIADYLFSEEAARIIVDVGRMHVPHAPHLTPEPSLPWTKVWATALPWRDGLMKKIMAERDLIKKRFSLALLD